MRIKQLDICFMLKTRQLNNISRKYAELKKELRSKMIVWAVYVLLCGAED